MSNFVRIFDTTTKKKFGLGFYKNVWRQREKLNVLSSNHRADSSMKFPSCLRHLFPIPTRYIHKLIRQRVRIQETKKKKKLKVHNKETRRPSQPAR
jgi:hypothetical protein